MARATGYLTKSLRDTMSCPVATALWAVDERRRSDGPATGRWLQRRQQKICTQSAALIFQGMLDIRLIREQPDFVKERLATRGGDDGAKIDEVLRMDASGAKRRQRCSNSMRTANG